MQASVAEPRVGYRVEAAGSGVAAIFKGTIVASCGFTGRLEHRENACGFGPVPRTHPSGRRQGDRQRCVSRVGANVDGHTRRDEPPEFVDGIRRKTPPVSLGATTAY
jgi:hypothetical protein